MGLLKYISLFFLKILAVSFCFAQRDIIQEQELQIIRRQQSQRQRIDSLSQIVSVADDTTKVNCFNRISPEYNIFSLDTAWRYASEAHNLAVKINFPKGIAESLLNLAQITQERADLIGAEKYFAQVPAFYKKINDLKEYASAVHKLSYNLKLQLRFDESRALAEKNVAYYKGVADESGLAYVYRLIGDSYHQQGYYEKAFEYFSRDMIITRKIQEYKGSRRDRYMGGNLYLAKMYEAIGDTQTAISYYRLSAERAYNNDLPDIFNSRMGDVHVLTRNYDSARYYYELAHHLISVRLIDSGIRRLFLTDPLINIGETYLAEKRYDEAIESFKVPLQFCFPANYSTMRVLYNIALAYEGQKNYSRSFQYATQLLDVAQKAGARQYIRDAFELYWKLFDVQGKTDSAYRYHILYTSMKDSIDRDVQLRNVAFAEMKAQQESKILLLSQEKTIQEQQKQLLIVVLIGLSIISIVVFRYVLLKRTAELNRRRQAEKELRIQQIESEKTKAELQKQALELEMKALRAQMNPHFIFNSLNSINRFIMQSDKSQASRYLTKFSRLIRLILQNSQASLITLDSELESLQLYLSLEALRFNNHFDYKISVASNVDASSLKVPPLILQPYVENAIWHGLMHKEEKGQLDIEISREDNQLYFKITDNGVGRDNANPLASKSATKHKSMGLGVTANRITSLEHLQSVESGVRINDLVNGNGSAAGTEVIIKMPAIHD